jgi:dipeptidyl-peptidase-4
MTEPVSFPRLSARTRNFSLGRPRGFRVAPDGLRISFLRSRSGTDPVTCLWTLDVRTQEERLVADPLVLLAGNEDDLPPEERARRERAREQASGIVAYAADDALTVASFALNGRLFRAELLTGVVDELPSAGPVVDPRVDPTGERIAYVSDGGLHVVDDNGSSVIAHEDGVTWGLPEFVASEEMGRFRGYWWSPDGTAIVAARVDESAVQQWWIADPASPSSEPVQTRYPAAGTPNADVTLRRFDLSTGATADVTWDVAGFPYVVEVSWSSRGPLTLLVQSRDQKRMQVLTVDAAGTTSVLREDVDESWLEILPGIPDWTADGQLVMTSDDRSSETRRLTIDGEMVTPPALQVDGVLQVDADGVVFSASDEPSEAHVWRLSPTGDLERLSPSTPSVSSAAAGGGTVVMVTSSIDAAPTATVTRTDRSFDVTSYAETANVRPAPTFLRAGERSLRTAVLFPTDRPTGALPVLMAPYGGPGHNRVVHAAGALYSAQWWADQGFAVVIADGRGTQGRGPTWERAIAGDFATAVLDDQVAALEAVAQEHAGELDLQRVGIHGWSFGGYLAALAVLRRPDVFHAAAAGAPVSDWRLYDTHYTERYLGDPNAQPDVYARSSLLDDAAKLARPLLLIHGLADDNVVAAHTLRLSSALLAAGRPHRVLPLTGVTHMTPQEVVAENLLLFELAFFREGLDLA